jgi:WhiB family redox-sensing transcriptional regulator
VAKPISTRYITPYFETAKCLSHPDPDWFFNYGSNRRREEIAPEQKAYCQDCPVLRQCYEYALHVDVRGVWGGTTYTERRQARKELGIVVEIFDTAQRDTFGSWDRPKEERGDEVA